MTGETLTESERLFERFCELEKIPWVRIQLNSTPGVRSTDYDIVLGGKAIVAEVTFPDPGTVGRSRVPILPSVRRNPR